MKLQAAKAIADHLVEQLAPHCIRIEIAGSIRREKPEVKDIEIVAIPKPYEIGLFESGIATVVNRWEKVKGELPCKYTQRIIRSETPIKLDLFFATPDNYGLILAIRTGSAEYSHQVLALGWSKKGYESVDGILHHKASKWKRIISEEWQLFSLLDLKMPHPRDREVPPPKN